MLILTSLSVWLVRNQILDGNVVAVLQPGAVSQGNLQSAPGPSPSGFFFTFCLPILLVANVPSNAMVRTLDPPMVAFTLLATAVLLCT